MMDSSSATFDRRIDVNAVHAFCFNSIKPPCSQDIPLDTPPNLLDRST